MGWDYDEELGSRADERGHLTPEAIAERQRLHAQFAAEIERKRAEQDGGR